MYSIKDVLFNYISNLIIISKGMALNICDIINVTT